MQPLLERLRDGDGSAKSELISITYERFRSLAAKILHGGYSRLKQWEETDDVVQEAALRLWKSLEAVKPTSVREYLGLGATQIRRQLLDLTRRYYGRKGTGDELVQVPDHSPAHAGELGEPDGAGGTWEPSRLAQWTDFHMLVEKLPDEEREVVDLLIYQELTQEEAAEVIGVEKTTVKRRWREARRKIAQAF
ncbi:MAG: sigma-70 family RNA polymerase sigma factor [Gemmatales bacterium]